MIKQCTNADRTRSVFRIFKKIFKAIVIFPSIHSKAIENVHWEVILIFKIRNYTTMKQMQEILLKL